MKTSSFFAKQGFTLILQILTAAVLVFVFSLIANAFTQPTQTPPGGNVSAPLNISSLGQSKAGGLILNTGGAVYGLIVENGFVGIGTLNPEKKLHVVGDTQIDNGVIRGATYGYGGNYTMRQPEESGPQTCGWPNPFTGNCSCPAGFTSFVTGAWPDGVAGYGTCGPLGGEGAHTGCASYICYK